jgi:hypothetical protein
MCYEFPNIFIILMFSLSLMDVMNFAVFLVIFLYVFFGCMYIKIKKKFPAQSFIGAHRDRICACVFIGVSVHTCLFVPTFSFF